MIVELPSLVLHLVPLPKRWLVCQIRSGPLSEEIVYAETFVRRSAALKAYHEAKDRTKVLTSYRMPPQLVRLPIDKR